MNHGFPRGREGLLRLSTCRFSDSGDFGGLCCSVDGSASLSRAFSGRLSNVTCPCSRAWGWTLTAFRLEAAARASQTLVAGAGAGATSGTTCFDSAVLASAAVSTIAWLEDWVTFLADADCSHRRTCFLPPFPRFRRFLPRLLLLSAWSESLWPSSVDTEGGCCCCCR